MSDFNSMFPQFLQQCLQLKSLLTPVAYLFKDAFQYFKMGYASALAWILFVIIMVLTVIQLKLAPRWVHYEAEQK